LLGQMRAAMTATYGADKMALVGISTGKAVGSDGP